MKVEIKNKQLIISIPLHDPPVTSKSGKTLVVASSHGNVRTSVEVNGKTVTVGVNAYIGKG